MDIYPVSVFSFYYYLCTLYEVSSHFCILTRGSPYLDTTSTSIEYILHEFHFLDKRWFYFERCSRICRTGRYIYSSCARSSRKDCGYSTTTATSATATSATATSTSATSTASSSWCSCDDHTTRSCTSISSDISLRIDEYICSSDSCVYSSARCKCT